ncbi:MAG: glycoside hydrolase [Candidatus Omnitrophica bacterium]|nr:glycoside hydrolase [Candidatus Omnitrophota bacterium]
MLALNVVHAWSGEGPKRIYVAPDDHTDYYWTATGDAYRQAFLDTLDYYLDKADETIGNPADFQSRWNCDGCLWMWEYEKNKPPADFQRLINRVKSGHISVPLTALVSCYGGAPVEGVLRGMYYPGRIERRFNLRFNMAVSMENQTLPLGLGALWAGSGARYTWKGICGCATKVPSPGDREHEIYWWEGPDGSRVLAKWYSLFGNQSIGGYAEAYNPVSAINLVDTNPTFLARYPYNVIGVFGQGWDGFQTMDQQVVNAAQSESNANRRVIVSNELDFFEDFEATHGAGLPTLSVAYGNEWELYCASMAEVTAGVRRAVERLRGAEALATLVALKDSDFLDGREGARDLAFMNLGLYWEHDWTADGPVGRNPRAEWQRLIGEQIEDYVETLLSDSVAALGGLIRRSGERQRFFAFNPLSWTRTDHADYPYSGPLPVHVVELSSGSEVPSQIVTLEGQPHIRILARNVPPVGYKTFEIVLGAGQAFTPAATVAGSVFENAFYRITLVDRGAITSLLDKTRGNREMVRTIGGLAMNDLGAGGGSLAVENSGPVSVTLKADSPTPLAHLSRITLFREINRIDIRNEITQNFGDVRTWSFGFELDNPDVWHEEVGAVIRAKLLADGGHYSGRNARYDWLTLNHFADIGDGAVGATLSSADCCFMRLGNSTATTLDTATPRISPLAGGQVDGAGLGIPNQHGDSHFLQRFALATHGAFSRREAMKFSLEHQNPLVAGAVTGGPHYPEEQFSLVTVSNPDVLLWALKPAEEGIDRGLAARFWNLSNSPSNFTLTLHGASVEQAMTATHLETETGPATLSSGSLSASLAPQQLKTFLLTVAPSSGVAKWELY